MDTPSLHHDPIKSIVVPIQYEKDHYIHTCKSLMDENRLRQIEGDSQIFVFRDDESKKWNIKIGLEFVRVNACPFCLEKL